MANEIEIAVKNTATTVAKYVNDVATLTVETSFVEVKVGGEVKFDSASPAARTIIRLNGNSETIVPMRSGDGGLQGVDSELFAMHQQNVQAAIEYRAKILNALLETFRGYFGK